MRRYDLSNLAPEPLALRIRPQRDECFDSWIGRVAVGHETTRTELFRHLGCDPHLAALDLARGKLGVASARFDAFDDLVDRLAWAVQADRSTIEATFLSAPADALLPPEMRVFSCSQCWLESLTANEPLVIVREWALRASWLCDRHRLPLSSVGLCADRQPPRAAQRVLTRHLAAARCLLRRHRPTAELFAHNRCALGHLLGSDAIGFRRGALAYCSRFGANRFHLSNARIALLAAAHSDDARVARRFEGWISLTTSQLFKSGGIALSAKAHRRANEAEGSDRERLVTVRIDHWDANLYELLMAYAMVSRKEGQSGV
jgi:hypothetical protein